MAWSTSDPAIQKMSLDFETNAVLDAVKTSVTEIYIIFWMNHFTEKLRREISKKIVFVNIRQFFWIRTVEEKSIDARTVSNTVKR